MINQPQIPDPERVKQQVANLRNSRLKMEEAMLEIDKITAKLEHDIRQKSLARVRRSLDAYQEELSNFE